MIAMGYLPKPFLFLFGLLNINHPVKYFKLLACSQRQWIMTIFLWSLGNSKKFWIFQRQHWTCSSTPTLKNCCERWNPPSRRSWWSPWDTSSTTSSTEFLTITGSLTDARYTFSSLTYLFDLLYQIYIRIYKTWCYYIIYPACYPTFNGLCSCKFFFFLS